MSSVLSQKFVTLQITINSVHRYFTPNRLKYRKARIPGIKK